MNEVALHRGRSPHLNTIDAFVDGQHLTESVVRYIFTNHPSLPRSKLTSNEIFSIPPTTLLTSPSPMGLLCPLQPVLPHIHSPLVVQLSIHHYLHLC